MGALEKFLGKPKEININGNKLKIHPLKVKDMHLFTKENPNPEELSKISKQLIKLSIPEATDEEVDNLSMDSFVKIMEEVNKLNGFKDEKLERIKKNIIQTSTK